MLDGFFDELRKVGADIPPTPDRVGDLIELADRVARNDALWAAAPALVDEEPKASLRRAIRGLVDHALS